MTVFAFENQPDAIWSTALLCLQATRSEGNNEADKLCLVSMKPQLSDNMTIQW